MSRGNWNRIKQSKFFYVQNYRKILLFIVLAQAINVILYLGIAYVYFHQPARDYYATSGIVPPVQLTPLDRPNHSDKALLSPDPVNEDTTTKVIPE